MKSLRVHLDSQQLHGGSGGYGSSTAGSHHPHHQQELRLRSPKICRMSSSGGQRPTSLGRQSHDDLIDNNSKSFDMSIRKNNKPLMEKKRRQRINKSLEELKKLITDPHRKESYSKLEKADILDMTVKFVQAITQTRANNDCQMALSCFLNGFSSCEQTTLNYLSASQSEAGNGGGILPLLRVHLHHERETTAHRFLHGKQFPQQQHPAVALATMTPSSGPLRALNFPQQGSGHPQPQLPHPQNQHALSLMTSVSPSKQGLLSNGMLSPQLPPSASRIKLNLSSPVDSLSSSCSSSTGSQGVWRPW